MKTRLLAPIVVCILGLSAAQVDAQTCEPELCDGADNDCDGLVDEDFPDKGNACTAGVGACQASGTMVCRADGTSVQCDAVPGTPSTEYCDDADNDCDGLVDEDFPDKGTACSAGVGGCQASGSRVCSATGTSVQCSAVPGTPSPEVCDDADNDCDGLVDDGFPDKGNACTAGVGACEASGSMVCNAAGTSVQCSAVPGTPSPEVCDDVDDDCDGVIEGDPCRPPGIADVVVSEKVSLKISTKSADPAAHSIKFSAKDSRLAFTAGSGIFGDPVSSGAIVAVLSATDCQCIQLDAAPAVDPGWTAKPATGTPTAYKWKDDATKSSAKAREGQVKFKSRGNISYGLDAVPQGEIEVQMLFGGSDDFICTRFSAPDAKSDTATRYASKIFDITTTACSELPSSCGACFWATEDPDAIYVDSAGGTDDSGCGPQASPPCATISFGLARAVTDSKARVYVSAAEYFEDVAVMNGIDLLGGYDAVTWSPSSERTVLYGNGGSGHRAALSAIGVTTATDVTGFEIHGASATTAGANSYAVYVSGSSSQLSIFDNVIYAGQGAPGAAASAADDGNDGVPGHGRTENPSAYDAFIAIGSGACNVSNNRQLSNAGALVCGATDVSGGNGGGNTCPPSSSLVELSAADGATAPNGGGTGGDAGDDSRLESISGSDFCTIPSGSATGATGVAGIDGTAGSGGNGCGAATGTVIGGHWISGSGSAGANGTSGRGGGGGGGGGGAFCFGCEGSKDRLGAHGGGGGSGGCGGPGGSGGGGGGGSFGLFVSGGTAPVVQNNTIFRGTGGSGGAGGRSGNGGIGGPGGDGGTSAVFCANAAGKGGDGGDGAPGGGGGGGCGGSSFGIFTVGIGTPSYCASNAISGGAAGAGGQGGPSLMNSGNAGASGVVLACLFN